MSTDGMRCDDPNVEYVLVMKDNPEVHAASARYMLDAKIQRKDVEHSKS